MKKKASKPSAARVVVRALDHLEEFRELIEIQRRVWRYDETDLTPLHQYRISSRMGAILLGGYVGGKLAGFVYSFPAIYRGHLVQHSHHLAVLPEFQGCGVGKTLKWAQRDLAVRLGYDLITWTFDPLQARNANLNLHTLGAFARVYWPNFYGEPAAFIPGPGVQTDRFLTEWPIREPGIARRRRREAAAVDPRGLARALEGGPAAPGASPAGGFRFPGPARLNLTAADVLVEVPRSVNEMRERPEIIAAWQRALRRVFRHYLSEGLVAADFICGDRAFYVLRRGSARR